MNTKKKEPYFFDMTTHRILSATALIAPLFFFPLIHNISNLPKVTIIQIGVCLCFLFWSFKILKHNFFIVKHPALFALSLWLFFSGLSAFWAIDRFSAITLWCHWAISALVFPIIINTMRNLSDSDALMRHCAIGASLVSLIACLQYLCGITIIPQMVVPSGTFFNPNVMAQYLVIVFPVSFLLFLLNRKKHLHCFYALMYTIQFTALLYTKTRAAWLALLLSILMAITVIFFTGFYKEFKFFLSKEKWGYAAASIVFIVLLANLSKYNNQPGEHANTLSHSSKISQVENTAPTKAFVSNDAKSSGYTSTLLSISKYNEGSGSIRLGLWINSIGMLKDYFFTGTGLGNFYIHYPKYHDYLKTDTAFSLQQQPINLHNDFFQIMLETSPVGLLAFIGVILIVILRSISVFRVSTIPEIKLRLLFLMMAICAFLVDAFFSFPLRMALPPFYLMLILGMIAAIDAFVSGSSKATYFFFKGPWKVIIPLIALSFLLSAGYFNMTQIIADHYYLKSTYYNAIKKSEPAMHEAEKSIDRIPWRYQPWFELAMACENLGLLDKSIHAYKKTLAIHPFLMNSQLKLSSAYLRKKDIKASEYWIDRALSLMPNLVLALYQKGIIAENLRNPKQAEFYYRKVIATSPDFAEAYYRLGVINLRNNKIDASKDQLEKAQSLKPNLKKIHFQLGSLYTKLNRLDDAGREFKKELHLRPENANAYTGLGLVYAKQQKWVNAVSTLKKAIQLNPNSGEAHMNLAVIYFYTNKYNLSLEHANIADKLKIPQAAILKKRLERAMGDLN